MSADRRVAIEEGVIVGSGGGRPLLADLYTPPEPPQRAPAVVLLHGGAWRTGDRAQLKGYGIRLGLAGYVCLAAEYRLADEAPWPAQIEDAKAAIRWLRATADDHGVDPDRIVAQGNSAGGHLALLAAGTPGHADLEGDGGHGEVGSEVAAVIAIYAPTRLARVPTDLLATDTELAARGVDVDAAAAAARQASPLTHVGPGFPPTLLVHGDADTTVPVEASLTMHRALREAGVAVDLHVYSGQPHAFDLQPEFGRRLADEMAFFLDRFVGTCPVR